MNTPIPVGVIAAVVVSVVIICCCVGCVFTFRWFKIDRRKARRVTVNIYYKHPTINVTRPLEAKEVLSPKRGKRLQTKVLAVEPSSESDAESSFGVGDESMKSGKQQRSSDKVSQSASFRPFVWISEKIESIKGMSSAKSRGPRNNLTEEDLMEGGQSKKSMKSKEASSKKSVVDETSERKKRFVSEDRLKRMEARKAMREEEQTQESLSPEDESLYEPEPVASLLDIEPLRKQRVKAVVEQRVSDRKEAKEKFFAEGGIDVVGLNGGPPVSMVPSGYRLNDEIGEKLLTPEFLVYKRVLYLWEKAGKADGWYIGTIVRTSTALGCNYQIKYDREETKNIFVDGVHPVDLQLSGENAYGRRWVVLIRTGPGRFSKAL